MKFSMYISLGLLTLALSLVLVFGQDAKVVELGPEVSVISGRMGSLDAVVTIDERARQIGMKLTSVSEGKSRFLFFSEKSGRLLELINENDCVEQGSYKVVPESAGPIGSLHYEENGGIYWTYSASELLFFVEVTSIKSDGVMQNLEALAPCEEYSQETNLTASYYQGNKAYKVKSGAPEKERYHSPDIKQAYLKLQALLATCAGDDSCIANPAKWLSGRKLWLALRRQASWS